MDAEGVADLAADGAERVERGERVLQHEADAGSADASPLARPRVAEVAAADLEDVRADVGARAGEPEEAPRGHALP